MVLRFKDVQKLVVDLSVIFIPKFPVRLNYRRVVVKHFERCASQMPFEMIKHSVQINPERLDIIVERHKHETRHPLGSDRAKANILVPEAAISIPLGSRHIRVLTLKVISPQVIEAGKTAAQNSPEDHGPTPRHDAHRC